MRCALTMALAGLLLAACDQVPTSLDETPYSGEGQNASFSLIISDFDFDYSRREFYVAVEVSSPDTDLIVRGRISLAATVAANLVLTDDGLGGDIQIQDGIRNSNWIMPDSLQDQIESTWTLDVTATSAGDTLYAKTSLVPRIPSAPMIESASHADTLHLSAMSVVYDTLRVKVTHPDGLDEVRDVSMLSLKPNGEYANNGNPIFLYDDGSQEILYPGLDYTSGDKTAGDGEYSLFLALDPSFLTGTYYWTFNARTWEGLSAEPFLDSLLVLDSPGSLGKNGPPAKLLRDLQ